MNRTHVHKRRLIAPLIVATAFALVATACGGSNGAEGITELDGAQNVTPDLVEPDGDDDPTAATVPAASDGAMIGDTGELPRFEEGDCPDSLGALIDAGAETTCGDVIVAEDRLDPDGNRIRLAVARIASTGDGAATVIDAGGAVGGSGVFCR